MTPKELRSAIVGLYLRFSMQWINALEFEEKTIELIQQFKKDCEKERQKRDAYLASYKGGLSKVEIWSLKQDELCDKIEKLILNDSL